MSKLWQIVNNIYVAVEIRFIHDDTTDCDIKLMKDCNTKLMIVRISVKMLLEATACAKYLSNINNRSNCFLGMQMFCRLRIILPSYSPFDKNK